VLPEQLISGNFAPATSVILRGLGKSRRVGLMPIREAIARLSGERVFEVRRNGRVCVPEFTQERFKELMLARLQRLDAIHFLKKTGIPCEVTEPLP